MMMNKGVLIIAVMAVTLTDVAMGGGPSCPTWDNWINASHPGKGQDEFEHPPSQTHLDNLCPPYQGVLIVQCTADPRRDMTFAGHQWSDDYEVSCNLTHGLACFVDNGNCPDHAIQYGCDCDQQATSTPTPPSSVVCPTQSGSKSSITAPPSGNNCSCPAAGSQKGNTAASGPGFAYTVILAGVTVSIGIVMAPLL